MDIPTPVSCCARDAAPCNQNSSDIYTQVKFWYFSHKIVILLQQGCLTVVKDVFVDNYGYVAGEEDMIFVQHHNL